MTNDDALFWKNRALKAEDRVVELEGVLEPFVKRARLLEPTWLDHECHWHPAVGSEITVGDLRRARYALAK